MELKTMTRLRCAYDARPVAAQLSLDSEGLALFEHKSAMRDFYDEDELRRVYYPEAERLVAEVTGASRVLVFDHTIRRRVWGGVDRAIGTPRQPVTSVHNDYTVYSGPQRVRDLMGEEADELLRHRFEFVNVWRPIRGPLRDAPLAVCDATTVAFTDFVASDLVYRDRTGETSPERGCRGSARLSCAASLPRRRLIRVGWVACIPHDRLLNTNNPRILLLHPVCCSARGRRD